MTRTRINLVGSYIFSISLVYVFTGFVYGNLRLQSFGNPLLVNAIYSTPLLLLIITGYLVYRLYFVIRNKPYSGFTLEPKVMLLGASVLLLSDFVNRNHTFYIKDYAHLIVFGCGFLLCNLANVQIIKAQIVRVAPEILLLLIQIIIAWLFLDYANGRLLFSDDHPSFLYRLALLREEFPHIPFYNIEWNAGVSAREFFASGMLNVFFLISPFLYFFDTPNTVEKASVYTYIIPYLYVFLVPWLFYISGRLLRFPRIVCCISALLALGPTLSFFEWLLKYGTIGFALSAGALPLTFAMLYRLIFQNDQVSWLETFLLLPVSFCCISWTPSAICFIPFVLYAAWAVTVKKAPITRGGFAKIITFCVLFFAINGPWIKVFVEESKVFSFMASKTLPGSETRAVNVGDKKVLTKDQVATGRFSQKWEKDLRNSFKKLRTSLVKVNPLLLFFGLLSLFVLTSNHYVRLCSITLIWILFIATFGDIFKPQLELRRLVVQASFLLCLITPPLIYKEIQRFCINLSFKRMSFPNTANWFLSIVLLGSVTLTPISVAAVYGNRMGEQFTFAPEYLQELSDAIREHGGNGRTFVASFILHELGAKEYNTQDGGHVAPLPLFSGKSMYAFDYYHSRWSYVDPIPVSFRNRGSEGIEEFLDLINASSVITFTKKWRDYCLKNPRYQEVLFVNRFRLFVRKPAENGFFLKGNGRIVEKNNGLSIYPQSEEVIIKFRYLPKLRVYPPEAAELSPYLTFIEDIGGGKTEEVYYIRMNVRDTFLNSDREIFVGY